MRTEKSAISYPPDIINKILFQRIVMRKKLGLLGLIVSAFIVIGCGGGTSEELGNGSPTPVLKISKDNKERVYSSLMASLDDFSKNMHLGDLIYSSEACNKETAEYECSGSLDIEELSNSKRRFTMVNYTLATDAWANTFNGTFTFKFFERDGQSGYIEFIFDKEGATFENSAGQKTTITSGKFIYNYMTHKEEMHDLTAERSDKNGNYVSFKNLTFWQTKATDEVRTDGWISSSFTYGKWFKVETKDLYIDTDDRTDRGYFLFTGADNTSMKILLEENTIKVYIGSTLIDTFYDDQQNGGFGDGWDDLDTIYDNRNLYLGGVTAYNLLANKSFYVTRTCNDYSQLSFTNNNISESIFIDNIWQSNTRSSIEYRDSTFIVSEEDTTCTVEEHSSKALTMACTKEGETKTFTLWKILQYAKENCSN